MDTQVKISSLFEMCGHDYRKMKGNESVDVSEQNVKVKTFNVETSNFESKRILKLVRKEDSAMYGVYNSKDIKLFDCTLDHKLYVKNNSTQKFEWVKVRDCLTGPVIVLNDFKNEDSIYIKNENKVLPVLDFEIEDNSNYFANGVLSHNTTSGGVALTFYASLRMRISRGEIIGGDKTNPLGFETNMSIVKSKISAPFKKIKTNLYIGVNGKYGIDKDEEYFDLAVAGNIIQRAGAWFSYNSERLGQGKDNALTGLKANEKAFSDIRKAVDETVLKGTLSAEAIVEEAAE